MSTLTERNYIYDIKLPWYDNNKVDYVPSFSQIGFFVKNKAHSDYFEYCFQYKDSGEAFIYRINNFIPFSSNLSIRIVKDREADWANNNAYHDEVLKKPKQIELIII